MIHPRTPVLIGGGQCTFRGTPQENPNSIEMCAFTAKAAALDAGLNADALAGLDGIAVVSFAIDTDGNLGGLQVPRSKHPPKALANVLGADPHWLPYSHTGGDVPQALVNEVAERIAQGQNDFVLLSGAEFLNSLMKQVKTNTLSSMPDYTVASADEPDRFGNGRPAHSQHEASHGLNFPTNVYPMFENALRAHLGRGVEEHNRVLGDLFAPFSKVAAANPHAWFRVAHRPQDLVTVSDKNRMVGFPYPKYLNAIIQVDQSASVLMASYEKAEELGVADADMVFLHGCAATTEKWHVMERVNYHSCPAMDVGVRETFAMAGKIPADMAFFDLYSCFPVAVELIADVLGIAHDDPRGLTLTGGLPYFGGPGNNYSMHAIVEMITRCRANPEAFGFINANGWYVTKHAFGIYSSKPTQGPWKRAPKETYQKQIEDLASPEVIETPDGPATIETYTVVHAREGRRMGIVIGRDAQNRRFVANTPKGDTAMMIDLESREGVGRHGLVRHEGGRNIFTLLPDN